MFLAFIHMKVLVMDSWTKARTWPGSPTRDVLWLQVFPYNKQ